MNRGCVCGWARTSSRLPSAVMGIYHSRTLEEPADQANGPSPVLKGQQMPVRNQLAGFKHKSAPLSCAFLMFRRHAASRVWPLWLVATNSPLPHEFIHSSQGVTGPTSNVATRNAGFRVSLPLQLVYSSVLQALENLFLPQKAKRLWMCLWLQGRKTRQLHELQIQQPS